MKNLWSLCFRNIESVRYEGSTGERVHLPWWTCREGKIPQGGTSGRLGKVGKAEGRAYLTDGRACPRAWRCGTVGNSVDGKM